RASEDPPQDGITTPSWFVRTHREVAPDVWTRAAIGSRANCAACHTRADKGDFDEDNVRIPK
ncbi:MAG: cytochrome C, partial [Burkholderiaceae bacterium]|nr:cytochrome C [Burkholderiaceae bacterium]